MQQATVSIKELADKIVGATPQSDPVSRQVVVSRYRLLAEGNPVPIGRLANTLRLPGETVGQALSRYPAFYDDQGAVIGFGGPHGCGDAAPPLPGGRPDTLHLVRMGQPFYPRHPGQGCRRHFA
jgi:alkylmercury lyase-like protein